MDVAGLAAATVASAGMASVDDLVPVRATSSPPPIRSKVMILKRLMGGKSATGRRHRFSLTVVQGSGESAKAEERAVPKTSDYGTLILQSSNSVVIGFLRRVFQGDFGTPGHREGDIAVDHRASERFRLEGRMSYDLRLIVRTRRGCYWNSRRTWSFTLEGAHPTTTGDVAPRLISDHA